MKKLLLFAVLALPAFPQFFGGSNASKIRGINVLGPLTVSDGCALVYVAASTRFECGAGSGGGTGNGIVAVTVSAATSATLTHNAALATPYIAPFVCREDTTNLPVIPATTTFTTNAIAFTFSPAFTGKCAASTGGSGISGSIATGQICYGSASNTCAGTNSLFWDVANSRQGINTATPVTELQVSSTSTSSPRGIMSAQFNTGTDGARFHGRKARGTELAPVVIVSGDNLTRWVGSGYDGSNYLEDASIIFGTEGTIAATRIPTNIQFLTATDAAPSVLTEAMRINAAQNVGIGTSSTITAGLHVSKNGALSSGNGPAIKGDGTWITGGSATTTKPYLLIEPALTTSTGWSTSGTGIGVNAASGFTGQLMDLQVGGATAFRVDSNGQVIIGNTLALSSGAGSNLLVGSGFTKTQLSTGIISFGGTTSSFPALKRSTTGIVARLADDSADTWFQASQFRSTLTTPASAAATCTAGTIVADTGFVYVCTATDTWKRVAIATW